LLPCLLALSCCFGLLVCLSKGLRGFEGKSGPGSGKHIVLLSGDEEYRSEEGLPQLAKILAERQWLQMHVLFSIDPTDHTINPNIHTNLPGADALDSADAIVMLLRFREWPDDQMKHFVDAYLAGKPLIALRTSTHAFSYGKDSKVLSQIQLERQSLARRIRKTGPRRDLGRPSRAHKKEATRGIIEPAAANDPILRGVQNLFGDTDVYTANPSPDVKILVRGQVLAGMTPDSQPVEGPKNNPMQPIVWTPCTKTKPATVIAFSAPPWAQPRPAQRRFSAVCWSTPSYSPSASTFPPKRTSRSSASDRPSKYSAEGYVKGVKPADLESAKWPHSALKGWSENRPRTSTRRSHRLAGQRPS